MPKKTPTVIRIRSVLHRAGKATPNHAYFSNVSDDQDDLTPMMIELARDRYEDLGAPDKITVTIEPGDILNATED